MSSLWGIKIFKKDKILIFFQFIYPWVSDFVDELSHQGKETKLFTTGLYGNYPFNQNHPMMYNFKRISFFGDTIASPKFFLEYIRFRPKYLILFSSETFTSILLIFLNSIFRIHTCIVAEVNAHYKHNNPIMNFFYRIKRVIVKYQHTHAKLIIAESEATKNYLIDMGCAESRIHIILHGTNITHFKPGPKDWIFAEQIGIPNSTKGKTIVLFTGAVSEYKGAEYLSDTIIKMADNQNIGFIIPFPKQTNEYYKKISNAHNVSYYSPISDENMPRLYNLSDIVLVPSKKYSLFEKSSDISPNTLIEAMACGKAVIGTDVGGIPSIMGNAGALIQPNDSNELIHEIINLASDTEKRNILAKMARERAEKVLNNKIYAERILDLLTNG